jgi:hypothetical protein
MLAQVTALDEIVALLLADHVQKTPDPMGSLRDLSNRLSRKLTDGDGDGLAIDPQLISDIESEFDHIIASARNILS